MATIYKTCRKRKRKDKAFGFHSFVGSGCSVNYSGPFRDNIRSFLRECAEIEDYNVEGMPTWCTSLVDEKSGVVIPLYVVEESVIHSSHPFCDHCRSVGWSHHFVSKRRYHMIIPADGEWDKPLSCEVFNIQTHLLHGLIHCNGFGHLLSINGHEGGSKYARGSDLMDLWDRLCSTLRAREVTLEDRSNKNSMELRLLYATAYRHTWFGRWGYRFCHGSFGVTEKRYNDAVYVLSSLHLNTILHDFDNTAHNTEIRRIIETYQTMCKTRLQTLRDLLRFMLESKATLLLHHTNTAIAKTAAKSPKHPHHRNAKYREFSKVAASLSIRWPSRRLECAAQVIVDALKENKATSGGWMTRQQVRDASRLHIGDTGLLDFVLKSLGDCIVGKDVVIRSPNPSTRVLEYTVRDASADVADPVAEVALPPHPAGRDEIHRDLVYLYNHVLEDYPTGTSSDLVRVATRAILNSKHFMKQWPFRDDDDELLRYLCWVMPDHEELSLSRPSPPPELVVMSLYATMGELKVAVEHAMRDSYFALEGFEVQTIEGMECEDDEVVFGVLESGSHVWVRGSGLRLGRELRYEGGVENWTVDCTCGARDDDGERMVACDMCEVWQHTRCEGIDDSDAVPAMFLCGRCGSSLMLLDESLELEN